jgi:hypothetical protein
MVYEADVIFLFFIFNAKSNNKPINNTPIPARAPKPV